MLSIVTAMTLVAALDGAAVDPPAPPADPPVATGPREVYDLHLAIDIPVTVVAGSVGLVRVFWEDDLARKSCPCDRTQVNPLDRWTIGYHSYAASVAANVTVYGVMAALPVIDAFDVGMSRAFAEDFVVYAETLAVDTALQNIVNFAVARPRPRSYAGDPAYVNSGEGYLSFYAGHVATAFSALSVASYTIGRRYGARVWPWIVTAVVAGSVAVERVASGHHFPSDVAVAAVMGTAEGITIPWLHARGRGLQLAIGPSGAGSGLSLSARF
jgi:membrane-associated phospholipid phosphatase